MGVATLSQKINLMRACRRVIEIRGFDLRIRDRRWPFEDQQRTEIAAHWSELILCKPSLWNGKVLIADEAGLQDGVLRASCLKVDYASFAAWIAWDFPDKTAINLFGCAVLVGCDGKLVYGCGGSQTFTAGYIVPPGGTPDLSDIRPDGQVDIAGSIVRELREETGIDAGEGVAGDWLVVCEGQRLCIAKVIRFQQSAHQLAERIGSFLKAEDLPELAGTEIIGPGFVRSKCMPDYAYLLARYLVDK